MLGRSLPVQGSSPLEAEERLALTGKGVAIIGHVLLMRILLLVHYITFSTGATMWVSIGVQLFSTVCFACVCRMQVVVLSASQIQVCGLGGLRN